MSERFRIFEVTGIEPSKVLAPGWYVTDLRRHGIWGPFLNNQAAKSAASKLGKYRSDEIVERSLPAPS